MVAEMELAQIAEKLGVEPELLLVYWFLLGVIGGAITTSTVPVPGNSKFVLCAFDYECRLSHRNVGLMKGRQLHAWLRRHGSPVPWTRLHFSSFELLSIA
jgi:hypothetical protein